MSLVVSVSIMIALAAVMAPLLVLSVQVAAACRAPKTTTMIAARRPRLAIVIPAHNEASMVARTIGNVREQMLGTDRVVVVADNCSDDTKSIAEQAGAEVVLRSEPDRIGKGYALDAGARYLALRETPEVVIILDADCVLAPGTLSILGRMCAAQAAPVQASYTMRSKSGENSFARIGEFAWRIKSIVRPTGFARLGLPCNLMGSGMAFPWSVVQNSNLATSHVAEDLLLGIQLALRGSPACFCPIAHVTSEFPASRKGQEEQRRRWIHGSLSVAKDYVPSLIAAAIRRRSISLFALACDLIVPPLAVLGISCAAVWTIAFLSYLAGYSYVPLILGTIVVVTMLSVLVVCWRLCGRDLLGLRELVLLPLHIATVIRIIADYTLGRRSSWTRTERED